MYKFKLKKNLKLTERPFFDAILSLAPDPPDATLSLLRLDPPLFFFSLSPPVPPLH